MFIVESVPAAANKAGVLPSRCQEGLDVLRRGMMVQVLGGVAQGVEQRFRLRGGLLLQELDATLDVDGGGPAEGAGGVHPVVQDDQPHHHSQNEEGGLLSAELGDEFPGNRAKGFMANCIAWPVVRKAERNLDRS